MRIEILYVWLLVAWDMKKGEELGIKPISTVSKEGTQKLKELHCAVNDVMYLYSRKYVSPKMAEKIFGKLVDLGKDVNDLEVPDKAKKKKEEILEAMRSAAKGLKSYIKAYQWAESDADEVQKTLNFLLSTYLKSKEGDDFDAIRTMTINKEIWDDMYMECPYKNGIRMNSFKKMQDELLRSVADRFALVPFEE